MKTAITAALGLTAAAWMMGAQAEVTVIGARIGANDVVALAKFYDTAFGMKEIDRVGQPTSEIIMRYGATAAAAKAGSSPEFLLEKRPAGEGGKDSIPHVIFHVPDVTAAVASAKAAGATVQRDTMAIKVGSSQIKIAMVADPDGNVIELMELPSGMDHVQHP